MNVQHPGICASPPVRLTLTCHCCRLETAREMRQGSLRLRVFHSACTVLRRVKYDLIMRMRLWLLHALPSSFLVPSHRSHGTCIRLSARCRSQHQHESQTMGLWTGLGTSLGWQGSIDTAVCSVLPVRTGFLNLRVASMNQGAVVYLSHPLVPYYLICCSTSCFSSYDIRLCFVLGLACAPIENHCLIYQPLRNLSLVHEVISFSYIDCLHISSLIVCRTAVECSRSTKVSLIQNLQSANRQLQASHCRRLLLLFCSVTINIPGPPFSSTPVCPGLVGLSVSPHLRLVHLAWPKLRLHSRSPRG